MKFIIAIILLFSIVSCSSFSSLSAETKIGSEEHHVKVYNTKADFKSLTYGDFKFAMNQKQFRKINNAKPRFKDILFYAKTIDPTYEYYVLYNPKIKSLQNDDYIIKDTIMGNSKFVVAISKNAPKADIDYIINKIATEIQ
ncbi:hypothetical protein [Flavobacterium sp.]|uniref:hypothetical protein n=1 Tax=Flavobacterium sp. TaxID=239 RepID=UPI0026202ED2|nr:hypothetical protein [Flavobacterium sp.]